jgi:hypothetical protein
MYLSLARRAEATMNALGAVPRRLAMNSPYQHRQVQPALLSEREAQHSSESEARNSASAFSLGAMASLGEARAEVQASVSSP